MCISLALLERSIHPCTHYSRTLLFMVYKIYKKGDFFILVQEIFKMPNFWSSSVYHFYSINLEQRMLSVPCPLCRDKNIRINYTRRYDHINKLASSKPVFTRKSNVDTGRSTATALEIQRRFLRLNLTM
jgi:hypothetical protein